ncbi:MAG: phosphotransferase [Simkaniaceae bacterium]|nr:phosphotransferase [Candidatus Sacchlamyda saccharinae]
MLEKHSLPDSIITKCLKTNYGIEAASLTSLPIGADIDASLYKVQTFDQRAFFIKIKRKNKHDIGVEVVEFLHREGIQQVLPPIRTVQGNPTQPIEDSTLIVYPFVEGKDGFDQDLTDCQWITLGKSLRQIHTLKVPVTIQKQIRHETYSAKWREAVRSIYTLIETSPIGDEPALKLHKFIQKNMPVIRQLVNRAEELGKKLQESSPPFVLCHSDIHGGNVLLNNNSLLYIVDWDEPILAPKERDLMFIGGSVGNVWNKPHENQLFYEGYGKTEIDVTALAYYRLERIVEDVAIYCSELLLKTTGGEARLEMFKHFMDMFEPQGVVDTAFKTAESL